MVQVDRSPGWPALCRALPTLADPHPFAAAKTLISPQVTTEISGFCLALAKPKRSSTCWPRSRPRDQRQQNAGIEKVERLGHPRAFSDSSSSASDSSPGQLPKMRPRRFRLPGVPAAPAAAGRHRRAAASGQNQIGLPRSRQVFDIDRKRIRPEGLNRARPEMTTGVPKSCCRTFGSWPHRATTFSPLSSVKTRSERDAEIVELAAQANRARCGSLVCKTLEPCHGIAANDQRFLQPGQSGKLQSFPRALGKPAEPHAGVEQCAVGLDLFRRTRHRGGQHSGEEIDRGRAALVSRTRIGEAADSKIYPAPPLRESELPAPSPQSRP